MPKYIIEREIPNAGALSAKELRTEIQWIQSYVTEDKITCVYIAPSIELVVRHARLGGFPADRVLEMGTIIDPTTAEVREMAA